jgi:hypothetical protein
LQCSGTRHCQDKVPVILLSCREGLLQYRWCAELLFFCPLAHRVGGHFADQPIPTTRPWEKTQGNVLPRGPPKSSILCPDSRPCHPIVASRLAHKPTLFALPQAKDCCSHTPHLFTLHPAPPSPRASEPRTRSSGPTSRQQILEQIRTAVRANSQISRRGSCALLIWPSVWPIGVWPWPRLAADLSLPIAQIRHRHNHFGWRQRMRGACAG